MKLLRSKRGFGLIDVVLTVALMATVGLIFATVFPAGYTCIGQAKENKAASAIAQQKIEQLRAMDYQSLTYPLLLSAGVIDSSPDYSPYSFTEVDNVSDQLRQGTGTVSIVPISSDVKRVCVTVTWHYRPGTPNRTVQLTTLFADKRPRSAD